ncbi:dihydroxyacetone kinase family protein [Gordonia sp. DT219]|uniref:dihydroxyacetone kinase family protein n=1 Tax=Gordonia sp. DT219 TaxID=3416658 RepID=UPI003CEEE562
MSAHDYILNSPATFLNDALSGFVAAHRDIDWQPDPGFLYRADRGDDRRVALVSGGGSGHEPMHSGMIGAGMLDAACPGLVFTSPNALQVAGATRWADRGAGVLHIVKNYTGDVLNFRIARHLVRDEVATDHVIVDDDVATASESGPGRRGTGATIIVEKICGAAAAEGRKLDEVAEIGRRVAANARSIAVAYQACTVPGSSAPAFELSADEMEFGVGIHGEAGVRRTAKVDARELVNRMVDPIVDALSLVHGEQVIALVNGLGSAHQLELDLVFGEVVADLDRRGITVARPMVGTFVTALDMDGVSITLVRADDDVLALFDAPTTAPAWPYVPARAAGGPVQVTFAEPDDAADDGPECGWLSAFVERVQGSIDDLTDLDRRAGDGDFGVNMDAALGHFAIPLRGSDTEVLDTIATSFLVRAGGTSGALFGVLFRQLATSFADGRGFDESLSAGAQTALAEITDLGGASVGDNTMVDALSPAVDALADGDTGAAAAAAERGARSTEELTAAKGRASYVGENARGVIDPGALVVSWLFRAAADHS